MTEDGDKSTRTHRALYFLSFFLKPALFLKRPQGAFMKLQLMSPDVPLLRGDSRSLKDAPLRFF